MSNSCPSIVRFSYFSDFKTSEEAGILCRVVMAVERVDVVRLSGKGGPVCFVGVG